MVWLCWGGGRSSCGRCCCIVVINALVLLIRTILAGTWWYFTCQRVQRAQHFKNMYPIWTICVDVIVFAALSCSLSHSFFSVWAISLSLNHMSYMMNLYNWLWSDYFKMIFFSKHLARDICVTGHVKNFGRYYANTIIYAKILSWFIVKQKEADCV